MVDSFEDNTHLISQIKEGNIKAYNYLVNKFHDKLFAYALTLTNDYPLAQDIIQNVFLKTWEHRSTLETIYPIKSFLFRVVYNEFVSIYHKNRSSSNVEKKYLEILNNYISDENEDLLNNKKNIIKFEMDMLPKKCKEVFFLSKKEGLTNEEISTHLNLSLKTVEGHITKAYSILRKNCAQELETYLF